MRVKPGEKVEINGTIYRAGDELPKAEKPKEDSKPDEKKQTKPRGGR